MACSSGNSSVSTQLQNNSGSEEDLQLMMNERKRKRMQSNRESARRSRMRKQQHLDELMGQVTQLSKENSQMLSNVNMTAQLLMNIESENSVLIAQMMELNQRLDSLNDILNFINSNANEVVHQCETNIQSSADSFMSPWNFICVNQPIMASADMFQY